MVGEITEQLDNYDLQKAVDSFVGFIDLLNNWYIRARAGASGARGTTPTRSRRTRACTPPS